MYDIALMAYVWMGVEFCRFAMCGPSGMTDSHSKSLSLKIFGFLFKVFEFAYCFEDRKLFVV